MVVVLAHITVIVGCEAAFEVAARELAAATLEREHGIRRYEYVRLSEPASYQATLAFDDYDAFIEHQASEHHHVLAGAMRELIAEIRLERVDPVVGCSPLATETTEPDEGPGSEGPGSGRSGGSAPRSIEPADHEVLAARREHYRARYPMNGAAWWDGLR